MKIIVLGVESLRPAAVNGVVSGEERGPCEGGVLGPGETRSLRCLAGRRCLGSGRGREPGVGRESSEDDEEERERERTPAMTGREK